MARKGYGQFCPVAKASEILTERWTPLVVRELLMGSRRFNELRKGVPLMSPSLLSERLKQLEQAGVVERVLNDGHPEYWLTAAGRELKSVIELLGVWGQRWARRRLERHDLDAALLMWDIRRGVARDRLGSERAVVRFLLRDAPKGKRNWWLVIDGQDTDLCLTDPGYPVNLEVKTDVKSLTEVWMGDVSIGAALRDGTITLEGRPELQRSFPRWLGLSPFADVERPR